MLYDHRTTAPTPRARIDFDAARMPEAIAAVFDLTDPLRTNVQFTLGRNVMYADMTTLVTMSEEGADSTGVADTIVAAWKAALGGRAAKSNWLREISEGVVMVPLLKAVEPAERPSGLNYMN